MPLQGAGGCELLGPRAPAAPTTVILQGGGPRAWAGLHPQRQGPSRGLPGSLALLQGRGKPDRCTSFTDRQPSAPRDAWMDGKTDSKTDSFPRDTD